MWTCYVPGFPISLSARLSDNPECRIDLNSWQISDLEIINYFPSPGLTCLATITRVGVCRFPFTMSWCYIVILSQVVSFSLQGVRPRDNIMTGTGVLCKWLGHSHEYLFMRIYSWWSFTFQKIYWKPTKCYSITILQQLFCEKFKSVFCALWSRSCTFRYL